MFLELKGISWSAAIGLLLWAVVAHAEPARWFMPGPLGYEPGSAPPPPAKDAFLTRAMDIGGTEEEKAWSEKNLLTPSLAFSHNLAAIVRKEDYATHPEWFPLVAGQRYRPPEQIVNWNPDLASEAVVQRAAQAACAAFQADRQRESFSLGINDALIYGESPEMLPWITPPRYFRSRPNYSDLVFQFNNRVAEQVDRLFPDRYLGVLAYYWCEAVPTIRVHPQIVPFLTADRSQGYDRQWWQEETRLEVAWAAKGTKRLGLYDYLDGAGFLIPRLHTRLIAEYLPRARILGFTDYFGESSPNWGLDGPQQWLVAQLIAHPGASAGNLLDEYYARFFGEAAAPMRQFFERCEDLWMAQPPPADWLKHYRSETQAVLFPSSECVKLRALLEQARGRAKSEKVRQRVEFVSAAFGATERFVAFCEAKTEVSRMSEGVRKEGSEGVREKGRESERESERGRTREREVGEEHENARQERGRETRNSEPGTRNSEPRTEGGRWTVDGGGRRAVDGGSENSEKLKADTLKGQTLDSGFPNFSVSASQRVQDTDGGQRAESGERKTEGGRRTSVVGRQGLLTALERYLRARTEFVDYLKRLGQTQPLAVNSGKLDDFLCIDPAYDAALTVLESGTVLTPGQSPTIGDAAVQDAISRWQVGLADASRERLRSPSFEGEIMHGLRIAGLQYRADITAGWDSRVEPAENAVAAVMAAAARTGSGGLRLANHKYSSAFAWSPLQQAQGFEVAAYLRGQLSSSARVMLIITWLDASQRMVASRRVRFIPTSTTGWTRLRIGQSGPANAAWVGVGITVAYQLPGDWVDVDDVSLRPWGG